MLWLVRQLELQMRQKLAIEARKDFGSNLLKLCFLLVCDTNLVPKPK